jgi:hypothetical protein
MYFCVFGFHRLRRLLHLQRPSSENRCRKKYVFIFLYFSGLRKYSPEESYDQLYLAARKKLGLTEPDISRYYLMLHL